MNTDIHGSTEQTFSHHSETFVINIGRQLGSGGRAIGRLLAAALGMDYFDKEILQIAASESGFCPEIFARTDEQKGFFRSMMSSVMPYFGQGGDYSCNQISEEALFRWQAEAIRKAAAERSCVFIGRCADYILRDHPRCINVFVSADAEDRIRRIAEIKQVDEKTAAKLMEQGDKARADYYNFYSSQRWGAATTYHLCINSSRLGTEGSAEFIKEFVTRTLHLEK